MDIGDLNPLYTLFLSALLSSTLLPGGSEALLVWLDQQGTYSELELLLSAATGNTLGGLTTWAIGLFAAQRWSRYQNRVHPKAVEWIQQYGAPALLLSWLPIVGDGLCLAAGWFRITFLPALLFIAAGKIARYAALLWLL